MFTFLYFTDSVVYFVHFCVIVCAVKFDWIKKKKKTVWGFT